MSVNECGWVWMDAMGYRVTGGHKNKARRDKNGRTCHVFGAMAGEISPNIMFFGIRRTSS